MQQKEKKKMCALTWQSLHSMWWLKVKPKEWFWFEVWELFSFQKIIIVTLRLVSQSHGSVHALSITQFVYVSFLLVSVRLIVLIDRMKESGMPAWRICIIKHLSERQKLSHFFPMFTWVIFPIRFKFCGNFSIISFRI